MRGSQAPRQRQRLQVLRFSNLGHGTRPATSGVQRTMTQHIIDCLKHAACSASPNHGLTPLEIQRWEDDGGAILADAPPRRERVGEHHHEPVGELADAE
jgi:hypothetical protein